LDLSNLAQGRFRWPAIVDVLMNFTFSFPCITIKLQKLKKNTVLCKMVSSMHAYG